MKSKTRRVAWMIRALWSIACSAVVAAYGLAYVPAERALASRWAEIARDDAQTRAARQTLANAGRVDDARAQIRSLIRNVGSRDSASAMASLLVALSQQGRRCGVAIASIEQRESPKPATQDEPFRGSGVTIIVRGSFASTLTFLSALGAAQPLLEVNDVAMARPPRAGDGTTIEARIDATIYRISDKTLESLS